jgi:hypothetical protein
VRPDRLITTGAALALTLLVVRAAPAQGEGPIVITQREELDFLRLENVRVAFEMLASRRIDRVEPADGPTTRDREDLLTEVLEVRSGGYMGHPNLVELDLMGAIQLEQRDLDIESADTRFDNPTDIFLYDVSGTILREGKAPLTLYARRTQSNIDRQFADTLESVITEYGARLAWRSDIAPSFFTVYHRDTDQSGDVGNEDDFDVVEDTFTWEGQARLAEGHLLTWDYEYNDVEGSGIRAPLNTFERHDGLVVHTYDFGQERRNRLRSSLRFLQETGEFAFDRLRLNERLDYHLSPTLKSRLEYLYDEQKRDARQVLHRGTAKIRHLLYDSLTTDLSGGASNLTIEDFESDQIFGDLSLDYQKIVPYGRFNAAAALRINEQRDSERGQPIQVSDQIEIFDASDRITIIGRNIETDSIVVTDVTGFVIYRESLDYVARSFPDRVEIERLLGGAISPGEVVLVDYRIGPEPANNTTTVGVGTSARYDILEGPLTGLSLYMRYLWSEQDRRSDSPFIGDDENIRDLTVGAEYDVWKLSFMGEYQDRDSSLAPFNRTLAEARYLNRLGRGSALLLIARYDEIDRTDEDLRTATITLTARWDQQIDDRLRASLWLNYRDQDDNGGLDSEAFEQELELNWRYRQTSIYATIRNTMLDSNTEDRTFQTFRLGFRREF